MRSVHRAVSRIHVCTSAGEKYFVVRTDGRKPRIGKAFKTPHVEGKQGDPLPGGATLWIETDEKVKVIR